jgi:hypothetical protein
VEVGVTVGSSKLSRVSVATGVKTEGLDVGVSSPVAGMDAGASVGRDIGKLQDDNPRLNAMTTIQN